MASGRQHDDQEVTPGNLTPDVIAGMLTEDASRGSMGIVEDEIEPGDIAVVKRVSVELQKYLKEFQSFADRGNIRGARASLAELAGAVHDASTHINRLAKEKGLSDLKADGHT